MRNRRSVEQSLFTIPAVDFGLALAASAREARLSSRTRDRASAADSRLAAPSRSSGRDGPASPFGVCLPTYSCRFRSTLTCLVLSFKANPPIKELEEVVGGLALTLPRPGDGYNRDAAADFPAREVGLATSESGGTRAAANETGGDLLATEACNIMSADAWNSADDVRKRETEDELVL